MAGSRLCGPGAKARPCRTRDPTCACPCLHHAVLSANETEDAAELVEEVLGADGEGVGQALRDAAQVLTGRRLQSAGRGLRQELLFRGGAGIDPLAAGSGRVADLSAGGCPAGVPLLAASPVGGLACRGVSVDGRLVCCLHAGMPPLALPVPSTDVAPFPAQIPGRS